MGIQTGKNRIPFVVMGMLLLVTCLTVACRPMSLLVFQRDQYGIHRRPVHFISGITAKHDGYFLSICDSSGIECFAAFAPSDPQLLFIKILCFGDAAPLLI
ncbi:hypothetical protein EDC04DRAFT_1463334 [Pisolithus marmoratus]|nr:hypothetical protein EDC04DRAFT_1463334 [Pisolithus marmoratus]